MESNISFNEYLNEIKVCEDLDRLENELKIEDNYPILLYGIQKELFSKITKALKDSPKQDGIMDAWKYAGKNRGLFGERIQLFDYTLGTVTVQVVRRSNGMNLCEKDKIHDLEHSVYVMFHPYQEQKMKNVHDTRAMALAIAGFGEYIIRENLTARLPGSLDLNYISK